MRIAFLGLAAEEARKMGLCKIESLRTGSNIFSPFSCFFTFLIFPSVVLVDGATAGVVVDSDERVGELLEEVCGTSERFAKREEGDGGCCCCAAFCCMKR